MVLGEQKTFHADPPLGEPSEADILRRTVEVLVKRYDFTRQARTELEREHAEHALRGAMDSARLVLAGEG